MEPLVSIIVAAYNVECYISQCLESILEQTYKNLEIIVIDDGSTDGTLKICDSFKDSRLRVYSQKNKGLVRTRKNGIEKAKGEWVGFVDGDDWIEPNMYESLVNGICSDIDIVHSGVIWNKSRKELPKLKGSVIFTEVSSRRLFLENEILDTHDKVSMYPAMCIKLVRRNVAERMYQFVSDEISYGEDLLFCSYAIRYIKGIRFIPDAYYHYRMRDNSITHKKDGLLKKELNLIEKIYQIMVEEYGLYEHSNVLERASCRRVLDASRREYGLNEYIHIYRVRNIDICRGKKVVLYAAGIVGDDYYAELRKYSDIEVVAWVDRDYKRNVKPYCKVEPIDSIQRYDFDIIIIAILDDEMRESVKKMLVGLGVESEKIITDRPEIII